MWPDALSRSVWPDTLSRSVWPNVLSHTSGHTKFVNLQWLARWHCSLVIIRIARVAPHRHRSLAAHWQCGSDLRVRAVRFWMKTVLNLKSPKLKTNLYTNPNVNTSPNRNSWIKPYHIWKQYILWMLTCKKLKLYSETWSALQCRSLATEHARFKVIRTCLLEESSYSITIVTSGGSKTFGAY